MRVSALPRIDTKTGRARLKIRPEPHWLKLKTGAFLGYRKTAKLAGSWVARHRDRSGQQKYRALGADGAMDFDQAKDAAEAWFDVLTRPGPARVKTGTVSAACEAYAKYLEAKGRESTAADARERFDRFVNSDPLGSIRFDVLTYDDVEAWRERLRTGKRGPATCNRILAGLKAALTRAVKLGYAGNMSAWQMVEPYANADGAREVFLTVQQRRALLEASPPELRAYLTGLVWTGARPGELAAARVADFDAAQGNITLRTRKGRGGRIRTRSVPLTAAGVAAFKAAARGKTPKAWLFTMPGGEPWHRSLTSRHVRAAVAAANKKKAGALPAAGVCCYAIRHTVISEWLTAGIDGASVAKMAGTSMVMVERHYMKFLKNPAVEKLEQVELL